MILTRRKEKERREKKTSWTDDDVDVPFVLIVCFNPWKSGVFGVFGVNALER